VSSLSTTRGLKEKVPACVGLPVIWPVEDVLFRSGDGFAASRPAPGQDWMMMPEVSEAWVPVLSVTVIVKE
jgi:hypothetical protein